MSAEQTHDGCCCGSNDGDDRECSCHDRHECGCGCGCTCGCTCHNGHQGHGFRRQFTTRAERIAELEHYLEDLRNEAKGVEEAIEDLRRLEG